MIADAISMIYDIMTIKNNIILMIYYEREICIRTIVTIVI